jgi:hypothetical protein
VTAAMTDATAPPRRDRTPASSLDTCAATAVSVITASGNTRGHARHARRTASLLIPACTKSRTAAPRRPRSLFVTAGPIVASNTSHIWRPGPVPPPARAASPDGPEEYSPLLSSPILSSNTFATGSVPVRRPRSSLAEAAGRARHDATFSRFPRTFPAHSPPFRAVAHPARGALLPPRRRHPPCHHRRGCHALKPHACTNRR